MDAEEEASADDREDRLLHPLAGAHDHGHGGDGDAETEDDDGERPRQEVQDRLAKTDERGASGPGVARPRAPEDGRRSRSVVERLGQRQGR